MSSSYYSNSNDFNWLCNFVHCTRSLLLWPWWRLLHFCKNNNNTQVIYKIHALNTYLRKEKKNNIHAYVQRYAYIEQYCYYKLYCLLYPTATVAITRFFICCCRFFFFLFFFFNKINKMMKRTRIFSTTDGCCCYRVYTFVRWLRSFV